MKVVSVGGIVSDGVDYHMWIEFPFSQPASKLERARRGGSRSPVIAQVTREALTMSLGIRILGADEAESKALREALLLALDTTTAAVALVVSDDDGGAERYRYVVAQGVDEQRDEAGPGEYFVATLVTHGDTAWRAVTARQETWNVTASGQTTVVANNGGLPARPVYTVRPTAVKSGAGFVYKRFLPIVWRGGEASWHPTDVVDGGLDTAAMIAGGKIYNGGTGYEHGVAVSVDGVLRKRWFGNFNTSETKVWVNLDWKAVAPLSLAVGFGSGDTVEEIAVDEETSLWLMGSYPYSGILMIDNEVFTYTGRDTTTGVFSGVVRAANGSSAGAHVTGATIYLIQHDIWLLYGGTGVWDNGLDRSGPGGYGSDVDAYKPVIVLATSHNGLWVFEEFGQTGAAYQYRPGTWQRGGEAAGTGTVGDPWTGIELYNGSAVRTESHWRLPVSLRLFSATVIGRGINYQPELGGWTVGLYADGGSPYVNIPSLSDGTGDEVEFTLYHEEVRHTEEIRLSQNCMGAMSVTVDTIALYWATTHTPVVSMGPEMALYDMALTLENVTTGERLAIRLAMILNQQLEIDTDRYVVTLLDDGSNQYQAVSRNTRRREMLMLVPGDNTLRVTETGLAGVTVYVGFEEMSYS